ncbi:Aldolase-type TIM barrel [Penicillium hispanicum]|uniref:Aldolase-type TIM barrel n=1 Tax=Penicillium hispanicum TaxID=1080232 RepID=UPI00254005E2|nr:Aldolase-type TIM barrel [Penicillium hispanicum]KAJ5594112.1 Aldolase-type TIM barrel [Penicillium hispanicum]
MASLTATVSAPAQVPRVPIPANGVDYRGKIVLAPMVRSGELPSRLLALKYGADLVWGPETIDRSMIGTIRRVNPRNGTIEFFRYSSNGGRPGPATKESVLYRIDPVREKGRLVFQLGTATPELAVQAARIVANDVSGIDVNSGCPKPFSTSGGMGAALLRTPDKLVSILEALVREVGEPFNIGISVKIRILETPELTEALVSRLVRTGITGLTVHCRTTPMRPRERAIRHQLRMISDLCHKAGVACVMNGDVSSRDDGLALMSEYGVDGAMIATAAEANSSCFRTEADGGLAPWRDVVYEYVKFSIESENRLGNTKYLLNMMIPGKNKEFKDAKLAKTYTDICRRLKFDDLIPSAIRVDEVLNVTSKWELGEEHTRSKAVQNAMENNETARAAGGDSTRSKPVSQPTQNGRPIRTSSIPEPSKSASTEAEQSAVDVSIPAEVIQKSEVMA